MSNLSIGPSPGMAAGAMPYATLPPSLSAATPLPGLSTPPVMSAADPSTTPPTVQLPIGFAPGFVPTPTPITPLPWPTTAPAPTAPTQPAAQSNTWMYVLGGIVVVGLLGLAIWYVMKDEETVPVGPPVENPVRSRHLRARPRRRRRR